MDSLSNTTFFTKFKPQRYITTPRSWKQNCLKYSDHEASPKLAKRIQQIPCPTVKRAKRLWGRECRETRKNGRYKSVKSAQTNARAAKQMRPGYRTKSHSPGEDLEGNQGSPRVGKIFVDLRLAIKDLMQHFFQIFGSEKTHSKPWWGWVLNKVSYREAPRRGPTPLIPFDRKAVPLY